MENLDIKGLG